MENAKLWTYCQTETLTLITIYNLCKIHSWDRFKVLVPESHSTILTSSSIALVCTVYGVQTPLNIIKNTIIKKKKKISKQKKINKNI